MISRVLLLVVLTLYAVQAFPHDSNSNEHRGLLDILLGGTDSNEHRGLLDAIFGSDTDDRDNLVDNLFGAYKVSYDKKYDTPEKEAKRKTIFVTNFAKIAKHNIEYLNGTSTYNRAANKYADVDHKKFVLRMNGYKPSLRNSTNGTKLLSASRGGLSITTFKPPTNLKVPATVDWRTKGAVTPVKDQGSCGSCYTFSSTGSIEGQQKLKKGKSVNLSEQNLIDCSKAQGNAGCDGGLMEFAFRYVQSSGGIDTEESYPYEEAEGTCRYKKKNVAANVTGMVKIPPGDEKALQSAVASVGPVSVGIDASLESFQFYSSGIYFDPKCSTDPDHAVLVVGYGTENGLDYWIVKNSWGTDWGENGYVRMARNKNNHCGIANTASYPVVG